MPTSIVKTFSSTDPGAVVLSGTAGSLIALLDAYLVTGHALSTPTGISVTANVATVSYSAGHGFVAGHMVLVAGATPAGLNGEKRVLSANTNTITFAAPGIANGAATGSITTRLAPGGWQKAFSGTNLAAYRSQAPEATKLFLRVDDTTTTTARVVGYEQMTDVNTGTAAFPTNLQMSGGLFWSKSDAANTTARPWRLFVTDRTVYMWVSPSSSVGSQVTGFTQGFGDVLSYRAGDAFACCLSGSRTANTASVNTVTECLGYPRRPSAGTFLARGPSSLGGSVSVWKFCAASTADAYSGTANYNFVAIPYPNPADNALMIAPLELAEQNVGLMGQFPGVFHCAQNLNQTFGTGDLIAGEGVYAGKNLMALRVGPVAGGIFFIDATGPWDY